MKKENKFLSLLKKKEQLLKIMRPTIKKVNSNDPQLKAMLDSFEKDEKFPVKKCF